MHYTLEAVNGRQYQSACFTWHITCCSSNILGDKRALAWIILALALVLALALIVADAIRTMNKAIDQRFQALWSS